MERNTQGKIVQQFVEWCESDFGREIMDREAAYIRKEVKAYTKILDVGCGIGSIEERLPSLNIVGIDISREMLKEARKRSQKKFVQGNAKELPFEDRSFDAVFSLTTLEFVENYEKAIEEVYRVLRKNGKFLAMILNPKSEYFKTHRSKDTSYFQKCKHEPKEIERYAEKYFDLETEYFLGIQDKDLFATEDRSLASLYVIKDQKR